LRWRKDTGDGTSDPSYVQSGPAILLTRVADVLATGPTAVQIFAGRRLGCIGCPFAAFDTLAEAAGAHGIDPGELADALLNGVGGHLKRTPPTGRCGSVGGENTPVSVGGVLFK
jgi:hybrid cluster-associated redox disulfide protein